MDKRLTGKYQFREPGLGRPRNMLENPPTPTCPVHLTLHQGRDGGRSFSTKERPAVYTW
jgi:hypothetical protein